MSHSQFNDPERRPNGDLDVSGPFILADGEGPLVIGEVPIRFLLVQSAERNQTLGASDVTAGGTSIWTDEDGDQWTHTIPADRGGSDFVVGATVRGIGLAVLLKQPPASSNEQTPYFETITWSVEKKVVQG